MPNIYKSNRLGKCPYCGSDEFDEDKTEIRNAKQLLKFCGECDKWSVTGVNSSQYPLQNPEDKDSVPMVTIII